MSDMHLDIDTFEKLFPFYFSINKQLEFVSIGSSLAQNIGDISNKKFNSVFEINTPYADELNIAELIEKNNNVSFIINCKIKEKIKLRGVFTFNASTDCYFFAGFPWFYNMNQYHDSGISYKQLGVLDPTFDYLNLIQTHQISLKDTLKVLEIFKHQKAELEKLSLIAEETTNAVIITNKNNEIEWVNKGFEKTYGYQLHEIVGKVPNDFLSGPLTTEQSNYEVLHSIKKNTTKTIELISYHKDGSHHWAKVQIQPIYDVDGNVIRFFSIEEDITNRKKIETELIESKKLLDFALEAAGDGVWMVTINKDLSLEYYFSNSYKNILGFNQDDIFNEKIFEEIVDTKDFQEGTRKFYSLTNINSNFFQDYHYTDRNGNYKHIISRGKAFEFFESGVPQKIVGTISDMTIVKTLELEAITTSKRLTKLIENLQTGVLVEDSNRKIAIVNEEFCKIFNIPVKPIALIGMDCKIASEQSKSLFKDPEKFIADIEINLSSKTKQLDHILEMKDGSVFSRDYIPIFHEQNYLGHLWQYKNITEMILREKSLENLVEKEKELNELKTRFIRITSHELRTPLAAIMTNSELLQLILKKDALSNNPAHDYDVYLNRIIKEVQRMNQTLSELVLVGKIEEGNETFVFKKGDIVSYFKDIIDDLFSPYSDGRSVEFISDNNIIELFFCKRMLKHALINVINNALKYSAGKPSPIVYLSLENDYLTILIQDFGIGIPKHEIDQVFTTFYRCSNAAKIQGTGIGLMLTEYIIKGHNGSIKIESEINVGTKFYIKIPFTIYSTQLLNCE